MERVVLMMIGGMEQSGVWAVLVVVVVILGSYRW